MAKFRKLPVVIEAEQWFPGKGIPGVIEKDRQIGASYVHAWIDSLEGPMAVVPGCWIITGVKGEKYPCDEAIFKLTYEPVVEPPKIEEIDIDTPDPTDASRVPTETLVLRPSRRQRVQGKKLP
jgi:hypothetical protein